MIEINLRRSLASQGTPTNRYVAGIGGPACKLPSAVSRVSDWLLDLGAGL